MRIAIDAMGTDTAPAAEVEGAVRALRQLDSDIEIVLVGDEPTLRASVQELVTQGLVDAPMNRLYFRHAPDRVLPGEPAATVLRKRPESSIAVGAGLLREREVDAFVSAGSTGAVMAASLFALRPLPGVERPAVATVLPTSGAPTLLLDAGTNVDCKPRHLVQFAHLGHVYARNLLGVDNPRVGLLNIGEEATKGDERSIETYALLAADERLNFVGNVEGRDIIHGVCDVLVTDGFAGNILLKFYESIATFMVSLLQTELTRSKQQIDLPEILKSLDYSEYGGAPLLGVNGVTIICHGGSSAKAICSAVRAAAQTVRTDMVAEMASDLLALSEANLPENAS